LKYVFCNLFESQSTQLYSDPNQNPFAAWSNYNQAAAAANGATVTTAPSTDSATPSLGGASLEWGGNVNDPNAKVVRLRDRLKEADVERRKDEEEADARERASEIRREIRMKKIKYLEDMPDSQPAGTGKSLLDFLFCNNCLSLIDSILIRSGRIHVQGRRTRSA
jgi:hypothetical protein